MKGRLSTRVQTRSFVFPKVWIDAGCACVCLRGSITYTAVLFHLPQFTQGGTSLSLYRRHVQLSPSFFFGDDALSRAWIKKSPFFREENHQATTSILSSIIGGKKQRFERWWRLIKSSTSWLFLEKTVSKIRTYRFLSSCARFTGLANRIDLYTHNKRACNPRSLCNYFGEGRASVNKLRNPARISNFEFLPRKV